VSGLERGGQDLRIPRASGLDSKKERKKRRVCIGMMFTNFIQKYGKKTPPDLGKCMRANLPLEDDAN
jgi:hypothetical protein